MTTSFRRRASKAKSARAAVAFGVPAAILIAVLTGCSGGGDTAALSSSLGSLQSDVSSLRDTQQQDAAQMQALGEVVSRIQTASATPPPISRTASLPATPTAPVPSATATVTGSSVANVRHTDPARLFYGNPLDLDAQAGDPNWNSGSRGKGDIQIVTAGSMNPGADAQLATIATADQTGDLRADCARGTYSTNGLDLPPANGAIICVLTSEKRYASMKFATSQDQTYTFLVTTFESPAEAAAPTS